MSAILVLFGCSSGTEPQAKLPLDPPSSYPEAPVNPQAANFSLSALDFVATLDAGWNLGNTLDAYLEGVTGVDTETCWSQPTTTQAMMTGLKSSGITTVRIPVTWHNHVDGAFTVDPAWMTRVKEVVDYALNAGLHVIINTHHDNDTEYYYPDNAHKARSLEYAKRVWKQIALIFRNCDERLVFEVFNEPRLVGYVQEWNWSESDPRMLEAADVLRDLEQAALNEIRATGSNNANRYVMITPYASSPWVASSSRFAFPVDSATDKLILSVHAYTPDSFAMQDPGETAFTAAHEAEIDSFMDMLNAKFVTGLRVPVVIGEYGATNKNNLSDRVAWFSYYCGKAASYGMCTILWDNGKYQVPLSGSFNDLYGF